MLFFLFFTFVVLIVGCDNLFFCPYSDPPLTSVDLHPAEMAQSAVRELLLARESSSRSFAIVREATLVIRESCGAHLGRRGFGQTEESRT